MRLPLIPLLLSAVTPALFAQGTTRGVQLFESHDRAGARAEFTAALQRNDRDARTHYYLGRLATIENDPDAAAAHLERAVKLDGNVSDYHYWYANAIVQQVTRASKIKQPMLARRMRSSLERAVALDERNIGARDLLVDFYSRAPGMVGGSMDKARAQAQAIARLDPMRGHLAIARLAIVAKDTTAVEREMEAAIAVAPDSLRSYAAFAIWYTKANKWTQAFAILDRYIERRPNDPHGPYAIGRVAAFSGQQLARGELGIRAFLANPPREAAPPLFSRVYLRLGQVLGHQGKTAEARAALEQALTLDPRNDDAKKALATLK